MSAITLIHGDCDYLIYKEYKSFRKDTKSTVLEIDGNKNINISSIRECLTSYDLFQESSSLIIRQINEGKSFFPFVEELTTLIKDTEINNQLFIYNYGKVLKTSKIYKAINTKGKIIEINQPTKDTIKKDISKSLEITAEATELLIEFTNSNLFLLKQEIQKLRNYLISQNKSQIEAEDIKRVSVNILAPTQVWNIGNIFLNYVITKEKKIVLIKELEDLIESETPVMQIIYSFYQYTLNAIKMKQLIKEGKDFKECLSLGYYFVKEFFPAKDKLNIKDLYSLNSNLLELEYSIKTGQLEDIIGLRKFVLSL